MAGVFPVFSHSPQIYKVWATPIFWSNKIIVNKNECGNAYIKKMKLSSESRAKSPFLFKVQLGEFGKIYEYIGSGKYTIDIPEECFHIRLFAKSLGLGQIIRCELY